ncbi:Proteasome subunit beta type-3 [Tupaia chinensis]|uniref:Proteasome subunit beta type-3 n=1 Tax=Tupaia chinensis TaxID=246437 RepID=L9KFZ9_TUPCH|nr:Proteasome subunit beta type-3 [Tupaia chinensis]
MFVELSLHPASFTLIILSVSGTCSEQMYGMCESLWEANMDPEHLFETISQAMLNAVDRDAVPGIGVIVHVTEKDKITTRTPKARMD